MKKCFTLILTVVLILSVFTCSTFASNRQNNSDTPTIVYDDKVDQGYAEVAQEDNLTLFANDATGEIYISDTNHGKRWYSNPTDRDNDNIASGLHKMNMASQLYVKYLTPKKVTDEINNYVGSVKRGTFKASRIEKGIRFEFDFQDEGFIIPVEYRLQSGKLYAEIILDEIIEQGENKILECSLLPYFGAADSKETGYIMLPDGCGALIYLGKTKENVMYADKYIGYVYGRDAVLTMSSNASKTESLRLPVFGMKQTDSAFLAIIEKGSALTKISAAPNNKETSYANVYPSVILRNSDNAALKEMNGDERTVLTFNEYKTTLKRYTVSYTFLNNNDANYSGMAKKTREYFIDMGMESKKKVPSPFYLEITASVRKPDIPTDRVQPLTTFSEITQMIDNLTGKGISHIKIKLDAWNSGSMHKLYPAIPYYIYAEHGLQACKPDE